MFLDSRAYCWWNQCSEPPDPSRHSVILPHELTHWVGTDGKHKNEGVNDILQLATARSEDFFFVGIPLLHDIDIIHYFHITRATLDGGRVHAEVNDWNKPMTLEDDELARAHA